LSLGRAPKTGEPSALHAELVTHEYTHGVVHRMVGGRLATAWLIQQQSQAMDEGWADYFAITLRNFYLHPASNYQFAGWAGPGFRSASYDPAVVRDYGKLGKPPQNTINGAGEIFAAALIRFNEFLGAKLGDPQKGHCIGWRAVVESLRLIDANPHFLQGRDALLGGIDELEQGALIDGPEAAAAHAAAREAFARYGMGKNAKSPNASFKGTVGDTTI
jgi:extracellular elastinolytic metalloproteinase